MSPCAGQQSEKVSETAAPESGPQSGTAAGDSVAARQRLWSGTTPAPPYIRRSVGWLWRRLRTSATITKTLRQVLHTLSALREDSCGATRK